MYLVNNIPFLTIENLESFPDAIEITTAQYNFAVLNPSVTMQEILDMQLVEYIPTLEDFKNAKIAEIESAYQAWVSAGYFDTVTGLTLVLGDNAEMQYTKLDNITKKRSPGATCKIGVLNDWRWAEIERDAVQDLLKRYGEYSYPVFEKRSTLTNYVMYVSQTIAEVEAVTW